jgi:uncharacterized protein YjgD (DUF1641 family)
MKYLKYLKESIISDKIEKLEDLILDLKDDGLIVDIIKDNPPTFQLHDNGNYITSINNSSSGSNIFILVYKIKNEKLSKFNANELSTISEFIRTLRSYKLDRSTSGGDGFYIFRIPKRDLYNSNL